MVHSSISWPVLRIRMTHSRMRPIARENVCAVDQIEGDRLSVREIAALMRGWLPAGQYSLQAQSPAIEMDHGDHVFGFAGLAMYTCAYD